MHDILAVFHTHLSLHGEKGSENEQSHFILPKKENRQPDNELPVLLIPIQFLPAHILHLQLSLLWKHLQSALLIQ